MNNKKRKLQYIRTKNNLKSGKVKFYLTQKVSHEYIECNIDSQDFDIEKLKKTFEVSGEQANKSKELFDSSILLAKKQLRKIYKIDLPIVDISVGTVDDDFIRNLLTYQVTLSK